MIWSRIRHRDRVCYCGYTGPGRHRACPSCGSLLPRAGAAERRRGGLFWLVIAAVVALAALLLYAEWSTAAGMVLVSSFPQLRIRP